MPVKPRIYVETSVLSYLTARPSRDPIVAGNQAITRAWWKRRQAFDLRISLFVLHEAGRGDPEAAGARLRAVSGVPEIDVTDIVENMAISVLTKLSLPEKARLDALPIAAAAFGGVDYLLTWNCAHIANPAFQSRIGAVIRSFGYAPPAICTPQQLIEA